MNCDLAKVTISLQLLMQVSEIWLRWLFIVSCGQYKTLNKRLKLATTSHIYIPVPLLFCFFYTRLLCWAIACWRESEKIRRQQDIKQLRQQASPWQIRLFKLFKPWTSLARQLATWRPCRSHVTDIWGGQSQAGLQAEEAGLKLSGRCDWLCVGRQKIPVWLHPTVGKGRNGQAKNCDFRRLGQWLEIFVVSAGQCEKIRQVINPVRDRWSDRNKTEAVEVSPVLRCSLCGPI